MEIQFVNPSIQSDNGKMRIRKKTPNLETVHVVFKNTFVRNKLYVIEML